MLPNQKSLWEEIVFHFWPIDYSTQQLPLQPGFAETAGVMYQQRFAQKVPKKRRIISGL